MKYLDNPVLSQLSAVLSSTPTPEARVNARVEAYSIKPVAKERKMFKEMEEAYVSGQEEMDEMSFSLEMKEAGLSSCFGRLDVKESRKVHFLLVSTLNTAFPEYDFSALRPDHFTREISAPQVLLHLSSNLLAINTVDLSPLSAPPVGSHSSQTGSSPHAGYSGNSNSPVITGTTPPTGADVGNPTLYRILNDVLPLHDCEVYSWFPEPEYDPHVDPEENEEASEYEDDDSDEMDLDDSMDLDEGMSWGQAGIELELDDVPSAPTLKRHSFSHTRIDEDFAMTSPRLGAVDEWGQGRKVGGLLWSANYFFYSKRQKRVLFITTWCRKRPSHERAAVDMGETGSLPLPISSSFASPSSTFTSLAPNPGKASRPPRVHHHNISNARPSHRRSKLAKMNVGKSLTTATIPIRGMSSAAPTTPGRLAASAPSTLSPFASPSANRMGGGGIKPRQTTARMLINAAAASGSGASSARPSVGAVRHVSDSHDPASSTSDPSRIRKERSGSLTPGPSLGLGLGMVQSDVAKGKRVKV